MRTWINRNLVSPALCLGFGLMMNFTVSAEPKVTFPVPGDVSPKDKQLTLTISIPSRLDKTQRDKEIKNKPVLPEKRIEHKYFDLNPFPSDVTREDMAVIKKYADAGICDEAIKKIVYNKMVSNNYEIARTLKYMIELLYTFTPQQLIDRKITQADIRDLKLLLEKYKTSLRIMGFISKNQYAKLDMIARKITLKSGEVKVVKVEEGENGETLIHLTLREMGDIEKLYPPEELGTTEIRVAAGNEQQTKPEFVPYEPPKVEGSVPDFIVPSANTGTDLPEF